MNFIKKTIVFSLILGLFSVDIYGMQRGSSKNKAGSGTREPHSFGKYKPTDSSPEGDFSSTAASGVKKFITQGGAFNLADFLVQLGSIYSIDSTDANVVSNLAAARTVLNAGNLLLIAKELYLWSEVYDQDNAIKPVDQSAYGENDEGHKPTVFSWAKSALNNSRAMLRLRGLKDVLLKAYNPTIANVAEGVMRSKNAASDFGVWNDSVEIASNNSTRANTKNVTYKKLLLAGWLTFNKAASILNPLLSVNGGYKQYNFILKFSEILRQHIQQQAIVNAGKKVTTA